MESKEKLDLPSDDQETLDTGSSLELCRDMDQDSDHVEGLNGTKLADVCIRTDDRLSVLSISSKEIDKDKNYGWFKLEPGCLQWFNTALWFSVVITVVNLFQSGTTNGLMGAVQSSIEVRYQLTSTQSSWIVITYEIMAIPLSIWVMYEGTVGIHRPRWTSSFLMVSVVGCVIYALPQFLTGVYTPSGQGADGVEQVCGANMTSCSADQEGEGSLQVYLALFILGRIGLAFGGAGLYNFGVTYLDDTTRREKFSLYSSFLALGGVVGPALGFILGGYLLTLHVDFIQVDEDDPRYPPDFDQGDPRWVGAWWLGYVIAAVGMLLTTLPLTGYPYDLPGADELRLQKKTEASGVDDDPTISHLKIDFGPKDVPKYLKDIFTNWSFDCLCGYLCCDFAIISGFTIFGPKYVEVMFNLTAAQAGVIFGLLVVPAGVVGAISGGVIIERFKMPYQTIVKTQFFVSCLVLLTSGMFLITCNQVDFVGVSVDYMSTRTMDTSELNLTAACNVACRCEEANFDPVCYDDKLQYYSPCHAGCVDYEEEEDGSKIYHNCSCLPEANLTQINGGICPNPGCRFELILFSVLIFLAMVGLFMTESMNITTVLRVVPNSHRLFAMFCQGLLQKFLGNIPGPLIFGSAFDAACILWQDTCYGQGSCFYYDTRYLGFYMLITAGCVKLGACIFMFMAWKLYKPPRSLVEEMDVHEPDLKPSYDNSTYHVTKL